MILFSSIQESLSQFSSVVFSSGNCCTSTLIVEEDVVCDVVNDNQQDTCCEDAACDCTCCIHVSLFNTSFGELACQDEAEKDIYTYVDTQGFLIPFPIFHPPVTLG